MIIIELRYPWGIRNAIRNLYDSYAHFGYLDMLHKMYIYKSDDIVECPCKQRRKVKLLTQFKYPSQLIVLPIILNFKPVSIHKYAPNDFTVHVVYAIDDAELSNMSGNEFNLLHAYLTDVMKEEELFEYVHSMSNWNKVKRIWIKNLRKIVIERL